MNPSATWFRHDPMRRLAWIIGLSVILASPLSHRSRADDSPSAAETPVVKLIVDYGDGVQKHFDQLEWRERSTVFDVMQQATRHPRGVQIEYRGKGSTILVTQIDDVKNEGGAGSGRNWIYRVNGDVGDRSVGICPVEPGDTVLWRFETYR